MKTKTRSWYCRKCRKSFAHNQQYAYQNKEIIAHLYGMHRLSAEAIGDILNTAHITILRQLRKFGLEARERTEAIKREPSPYEILS